MASTSPTKTLLNDPDLMFTEDIRAEPEIAPQLWENRRIPKLRIYARGQGPGNPDIVTPRTEAYILSWSEPDPDIWG